MKQLWLTLILVSVVALGLGGIAYAQNAASDSKGGADIQVGCTGPCTMGPSYKEGAGEKMAYKVTGLAGSLTVKIEDGCLVGDTFTVKAKIKDGVAGKAKSSGAEVAGCTCSYSTVVVDDASATTTGPSGNPAKVVMKAVAIPAGVPATAYINFSKGTVTQTKGADSCLF